MEKSVSTLFASLLLTVGLQAQPAIQWQTSLGGTLVDQFDQGNTVVNNMALTNDGGYIVAGHSFSNDGDVTGHHGSSNTSDYWVVKLDSTGNIEWQRSLGGTLKDLAKSVAVCSDGGYIVAGDSYSDDGDVTGHHDTTSQSDAWVVKLDAGGTIQWQRSYGGSLLEVASHIEQTDDGGYIFSGDAMSTDGDVSVNKGSFDFWIVKLDSLGAIQWDKSLGGSGSERCYSIHKTFDGGYFATGITTSNDSDITNNSHPGFLSEAWVVKLDSAGNKEWDKCLGGTSIDWCFDACQTTDSGFLLSIGTLSSDGDITGSHGGGEIWLAKLDPAGNLSWSRCYGGSGNENAKTVRQTTDHGYLLCGKTNSSDGDVSSLIGGTDCWVMKTDSLGAIEWEKTYGGTGNEGVSVVLPTPDGGYAFLGESASNDGDVTGHHGATSGNDLWMVKLGPLPTGIATPVFTPASLAVVPNPLSGQARISFFLEKPCDVSLDLYDIRGSKIRALASGKFGAGMNRVSLDILEGDSAIEGGVYIIKMNTPFHSFSQKIVMTH